MVVGFDDGVVMRLHDLVVAHDCADRRARWELDVFDGATDDLRLFLGSVRNRLDRLGAAAAQGVNLDDVTAADVLEQRTDRDLLR